MAENFIAIALPHSTRDDDRFHVSVFISPKLDGADHLGDFPTFAEWTAVVADGLRVNLLCNGTAVPARPLFEARGDILEPGLWAALFPSDTPVRFNDVPDLYDRPWGTFDAAAVHDLGAMVGLLTAASSIERPPAPLQHPLGPALLAELRRPRRGHRQGFLPTEKDATGSPIRLTVDDEGLTAEYDRRIGLDDMPDGDLRRRPIREAHLDERGAVGVMLERLHEARRHYDRPDTKTPYTATPVPAAPLPPLPARDPEFHERIGALGDHPDLLRRLGLVIDLAVLEPGSLRTADWISAEVNVGDLAGAAPRTVCRCTLDGALVTVPSDVDWTDGALALGDSAHFSVLDADADGTALKTDQYVRLLPRLTFAEYNGEQVDAASPALRSSGFTVVRTGRADTVRNSLPRQKELRDTVDLGAELFSEDVARGIRVEAMDTADGIWRSLHARTTTVTLLTDGAERDLGAGHGFLQGSPVEQGMTPDKKPENTVHAHEAVFGWEGWNLSVPRPGRRIDNVPVLRPDGTPQLDEHGYPAMREQVLPDPAAADRPTNPLTFRHRSVPGTLPALRYGHSYAFRAWMVDLAGNVRPEPSVDADQDAAEAHWRGLLESVGPGSFAAEQIAAWSSLSSLGERLGAVGSGLLQHAQDAIASPPVGPPVPALPEPVHAAIAARFAARLGVIRDVMTPSTTPGSMLTSAARDVLRQAYADDFGALTDTDPRVLSHVLATQFARLYGGQDNDYAFRDGRRTVTVPRPYLRWDPVQPPTLVPRSRYSSAESQRVMVIRSSVEQDPETLAITVTTTGEVNQRLVLPPKVSQVQAEHHGAFDAMVRGERTAGDRSAGIRLALGAALRESGSITDPRIARISDPGVFDELPKGALVVELEPGADEKDRVELPLPQGEPMPAKQYVRHPGTPMRVPYLPDPLVRGTAFQFPDAQLSPALEPPFGIEGFSLNYPSDAAAWPEASSAQITLAGTAFPDRPTASAANGEARFVVPAGATLRVRVSSSLREGAPDLLGSWRAQPESLRDLSGMLTAAHDGYLWSLTPAEEVRLVHAVNRPVEAPTILSLEAGRTDASTYANIYGSIAVHGGSTGDLCLRGSWTDVSDDLASAGPVRTSSTVDAFRTAVEETERLALLWSRDDLPDGDVAWPEDATVRLHGTRHDFGDTKHRDIDYRFIASSRFREYFLPEDPADPQPETHVMSASIRVSVPSSSRPPAPQVHSVVPLFRWSTDRPYQVGQPLALRRDRRAGVRIYLHRPWFGSGDGELLAVLLSPSPGDGGTGPYSRWAADPIWETESAFDGDLHGLTMTDFLTTVGLDDRRDPSEPCRIGPNLDAPAGPDSTYRVTALGYEPRYNADRGFWFVDVALHPRDAAWPFLRLAVARYQPDSIAGCELSAPTVCDFSPIPPERTLHVTRVDDGAVRVAVSGPSATRHTGSERVLVATLQGRIPDLPGDLGWRSIAHAELADLATSGGPVRQWSGKLTPPAGTGIRTPSGGSGCRVTVEEWERFPGDPDQPGGDPRWEQRLVFADEVEL
ncbi:hypothetical protein [Tsukamurella pseudospumae]|uniref:Uncharacterized protein n=1 Tax=Tsukamurella pseudospumae TaxID=239498 RepID=A0A138AIP6_9ACTN|nr:hypothetical protein [Tsukamurella pseudospumae]KXP10401.1 hypothetical protein AXK60_08110 [Tsukamurella pseudospumae]